MIRKFDFEKSLCSIILLYEVNNSNDTDKMVISKKKENEYILFVEIYMYLQKLI